MGYRLTLEKHSLCVSAPLPTGLVGAINPQELSEFCDVYLVTECVDDEGQRNAERALAEVELLGGTNTKVGTGVIAQHKSLYCGTRYDPPPLVMTHLLLSPQTP